MGSLLLEDVIARLATRLGARFATLTPLARETLVTAEVEKRVKSYRMHGVFTFKG
jgi:hypothetical protein